MLLCYADIEEPVWKSCGEGDEPGAVGHCRRYGDDPFVLFGKLYQGLSEDRGKRFRCMGRGFRRAGYDVEFPDAVEFARIVFSRSVAKPLLGHDMDQERAVDMFEILEDVDHLREIVPGQRSEIFEAECLEERGRG